MLIQCTVPGTPPTSGILSLNTLQTTNKNQTVQVGYDFGAKHGFALVPAALNFNSNTPRTDVTPQLEAFNWTTKTIDLHVFVDGSRIETFFNGETTITTSTKNGVPGNELSSTLINTEKLDCHVSSWVLALVKASARLKLDDDRVACSGTDTSVTCAATAYTHQGCPLTDARASRVFRATPEPGLVPWPRLISIQSSYFDLPTPLTLGDISVSSPSLQLFAALLVADVAARMNTTGDITTQDATLGNVAPIVLLTVIPDGAYSFVNVSRTGVVLSGSSKEGLLAAMTTFLQSMELSSDTDTGRQPLVTTRPSFNCATLERWRAPLLVATDSPELRFRGMLSDVARRPVSLLELKQLVVLCRYYKLNHLHLHMSDNEAM